jgi:glycosyltransferase involved in cell wall biosynthesis
MWAMSPTGAAAHIALLHIDVGQPMGQQRYENEIARALHEQPSSRYRTIPVSVSSLRSSLASDLKLPLHFARDLPLGVQRAAMGWRLRRFDLVHRMDLRLPAAPAEVVTVHDVAPLRFPDEGDLPRGAQASLRRARAVIAPSSFAADDIANALAIERPIVIYNGVPHDAFGAEPLAAASRRTLGINDRYLLHCGGASLRKNLAGLHAAWSIFREHVSDVQLVLAGPADPRRSHLFSDDERVVLLGNVERPILLGLMKSASAVVVPSLYEGFGFPAVEAMACGTAVVATRQASLPEICGDGAILCEVDPESMADGMQRTLEQDQMRGQVIARGAARAHALTWEAAAAQHLAVYERSLEKR